jgi:predicted small secreted protein
MLRTRGQQRRATVKVGGWAELPDELLAKVLELLQAAGQARGLGFSQASATVRLVCAAWKAVHDALVMRLVLKPQTTDEAMGMLVRRFPAVVSLEMKRKQSDYINRALLTNEGMRAVSNLPALTSLNLTGCNKVTGAGLRAVSSCMHCPHVAQPHPLLLDDRRGHASSEKPPFAHLSRPRRLRQGYGRGRAGREQHCFAHQSRPPRLRQRDSRWRTGAPQHHRRF